MNREIHKRVTSRYNIKEIKQKLLESINYLLFLIGFASVTKRTEINACATLGRKINASVIRTEHFHLYIVI